MHYNKRPTILCLHFEMPSGPRLPPMSLHCPFIDLGDIPFNMIGNIQLVAEEWAKYANVNVKFISYKHDIRYPSEHCDSTIIGQVKMQWSAATQHLLIEVVAISTPHEKYKDVIIYIEKQELVVDPVNIRLTPAFVVRPAFLSPKKVTKKKGSWPRWKTIWATIRVEILAKIIFKKVEERKGFKRMCVALPGTLGCIDESKRHLHEAAMKEQIVRYQHPYLNIHEN